MSLDTDIKNLCDKSLVKLFSKESWGKRNKKNEFFLFFIHWIKISIYKSFSLY